MNGIAGCRGAVATLIALLTVTGLMVAPAPAQGDPLVVVHVDMDAWNQSFPSSAMGQCWNDPIVQQWRQTTLTSFWQNVQAQGGPNMGNVMPYLTGQAAIAVTAEPPVSPGMQPQPHVSLAFHQPGQIQQVIDQIAANLDPGAREFLAATMFQDGSDTLALGDNAMLNQTLGGMLASGPGAMGLDAPAGSFLSAEINLGRAIQMAQANGGMDANAIQALSAVGLANLSTVSIAIGFRGQGLVGDAAVEFDGPRQGLMGLVGNSDTFGFLDIVPSNSLSVFGANTPPPSEIFAWIESMVMTHGGPNAIQDWQQGLSQFQQETGLDMRTQVVPAFGQEIGVMLSGATGFSADAALVMEVSNQGVVQQLINAVIAALNEEMAAGTPPGQTPMLAIQPMTMNAGGVPYQMIAVPGLPVQICYGFLGNHLVVAASQSEMEAVCTAQSGGQPFTSSPGFQSIAGELPPQAAMFSYSDNRRGVETLSQMLMPFMMMAGANIDSGTQQLLMQLPSLAQHMGFKGSALTAEPSALRIHSYNTSGAEAIVAAMLVVSGANAAMTQAQQSQQSSPGTF